MTALYGKDRPLDTSYKLPNLCANCAAKPAETKWRIHQQKQVGSKQEFDIMHGVKRTDSYMILDFEVGVCKACEAKLKQGKTINGIILAVGCLPILLGGIGLLAAIGNVALTNIPHTVFIVAIAAGIIFWVVAGLLLGEEPVAKRSSDGTKFIFRNKRYQAAFAKLNPTLVSPDQK